MATTIAVNSDTCSADAAVSSSHTHTDRVDEYNPPCICFPRGEVMHTGAERGVVKDVRVVDVVGAARTHFVDGRRAFRGALGLRRRQFLDARGRAGQVDVRLVRLEAAAQAVDNVAAQAVARTGRVHGISEHWSWWRKKNSKQQTANWCGVLDPSDKGHPFRTAVFAHGVFLAGDLVGQGLGFAAGHLVLVVAGKAVVVQQGLVLGVERRVARVAADLALRAVGPRTEHVGVKEHFAVALDEHVARNAAAQLVRVDQQRLDLGLGRAHGSTTVRLSPPQDPQQQRHALNH